MTWLGVGAGRLKGGTWIKYFLFSALAPNGFKKKKKKRGSLLVSFALDAKCGNGNTELGSLPSPSFQQWWQWVKAVGELGCTPKLRGLSLRSRGSDRGPTGTQTPCPEKRETCHREPNHEAKEGADNISHSNEP